MWEQFAGSNAYVLLCVCRTSQYFHFCRAHKHSEPQYKAKNFEGETFAIFRDILPKIHNDKTNDNPIIFPILSHFFTLIK